MIPAKPDHPPLTLAAIVNDGPLQAWVHRALSEAAALPGVRLALIFSRPRLPLADRAARSWLGRHFIRLDRRLFAPAPALDGTRGDVAIPGAPGLVMSAWADAQSARLMREQEVDAVIDLSDRGVEADALATCSTWRLCHAGATTETAALGAVLLGQTTVRSALHSVTTPPRVLAESTSAVDTRSVSCTRNALYWKNVALVVRGVRRLQQTRAPAARPSLPVLQWTWEAGVRAGHLPWRLPTHVARVARARWVRRQHQTRWILLTGRRDGTGIADIAPQVPPDGHFWADPRVVVHAGTRYVFYEDYRYDLARGHIAVAALDAHGRLGPSSVALERPYHLSYPSVFQHRGAWYMVPETQANRTIEVFRCDRFPDRWQFSHVLMRDVRAVDATFLQHAGRWWLFANIAEFEGSSTHDDLFAFWADDPLSTDWRPHPLNPIVSDVGCARPAGAFVQRDGRLLRPSQDCGAQYGGAVCMNEVVALTETTYEERCIGRLEATWDPHVVAMHTVSEHGDLVLLDGKFRTRRGRPLPPAAGPGRCTLTVPGLPAQRGGLA